MIIEATNIRTKQLQQFEVTPEVPEQQAVENFNRTYGKTHVGARVVKPEQPAAPAPAK